MRGEAFCLYVWHLPTRPEFIRMSSFTRYTFILLPNLSVCKVRCTVECVCIGIYFVCFLQSFHICLRSRETEKERAGGGA